MSSALVLLGLLQISAAIKLKTDAEVSPLEKQTNTPLAGGVYKTLNKATKMKHAQCPMDAPNCPCPKVFVYDLPKKYTDYNVSKDGAPWEKYWSKQEGADFLKMTAQYGLGEGVLHRVHNSKRCRQVTDPAEADLFIIPILAGAKSGGKWDAACRSGKITSEELMKVLPHLNKETAHKHAVFVGKGHPNAAHSGCDAWWRKPEGLLQQIWRISYSENWGGKGEYGEEDGVHHVQEFGRIDDKPDFTGRDPSKPKDANEYPNDFNATDAKDTEYHNLRSVPYMSDFHWSANFTETPPWKEGAERGLVEKRKTLMAFFGKIRTDTSYSSKIRPFIAKECKKAGKDICHDVFSSHFGMFDQKRNTTFCLEPPGDSPYRKSISESLLAGCIPVIFSKQTDSMAPWHWGPWREQSRVFIAAEDLYSGKIDLKEYLQTIPEKKIQAMQKVIAENAHKMQYSYDEVPGDAVEVILRHVAGWDADDQ